MAQKFITKRNRHLFRKPVKVTVVDKIQINLPTNELNTNINKEVVVETLTENEIVETEVIETEVLETKKRKAKKSKETTEEIAEVEE